MNGVASVLEMTSSIADSLNQQDQVLKVIAGEAGKTQDIERRLRCLETEMELMKATLEKILDVARDARHYARKNNIEQWLEVIVFY